MNPLRFVDAAHAAFRAGASFPHPPHAGALLALEDRLHAPAAAGRPDPFALAVSILAHALYGESQAYWDEVVATFRRRFQRTQGERSSIGACEAGHELAAAVLRWRTLLVLVCQVPNLLHGWSDWMPAPTSARQGLLQTQQDAAALVYQAALAELWPADSEDPASGTGHVFDVTALVVEAGFTAGIKRRGVDARAAAEIRAGLCDRRLDISRLALSPLTQRFLACTLTWVGAAGPAPTQPCRVWADELAAWARVDPSSVHMAFGCTNPTHSPAHELAGRRVVLPDCRWADFANPVLLDLPWFDAPPRAGQEHGRRWQEVRLCRDLLPFLRRLRLWLDHLPLAAPAGRA